LKEVELVSTNSRLFNKRTAINRVAHSVQRENINNF